MKYNIYISETNNPYYNIATEYHLMEKEKRISLFLWQNKKCVVVGKNQNIYEQCNFKVLKNYKVLPVRRLSGGGAVYQDLGNLNYTIIATKKYFDEQKIKHLILTSLKRLNIECEFSGRNDLIYKNKKISGQAFYEENNKFIYHGTLLFDVDLNLLSKTLTPSKLKLESKGIKSVTSRVSNLKNYFPNLTIFEIKKAFISTFKDIYNRDVDVIKINELTFPNMDLFKKLQSKEWLYAEEPEFNIELESKVKNGNIKLLLNIKNSRVENIYIYTDSLKKINFKEIKNRIIGMWYDEKKIIDILEEYL